MKTILIILWLAVVNVNCNLSSKKYYQDHGSVQFNNELLPERVLYSNTISSSGSHRIRGMRDKRNADFVLGGLFPAHQHSEESEDFCSVPAHISLVDAMLFALDNINSDDNILPNITIGYDIRDTCFDEKIGLDEAADVILYQHEYGGSSGNKSAPPLTIGLIGAASSSVSIPVASIGQLFHMPQISYASQSSLLERRDRFSYFYRTLPSNSLEVQVIVDLLQHFGWSYISILYSRSSYGQSGVNHLQALATKRGMCIDLNEGIGHAFEEKDYRNLVDKLSKSTAHVVVLYATENEALSFMNQLKKANLNRRFIWIATSAWFYIADSIPPQIVSGLFSSLPLMNRYSPYYDYFFNLFPNHNQRNPWFNDLFSVPIFRTAKDAANCTQHNCTKQTTKNPLDVLIPSDFYSSAVMDAVYTYAHALDKYILDNCAEPLVWDKDTKTCAGQKSPFSGSGLLRFISEVNFTSLTGNQITFNNKGSIRCSFSIVNFQAETDGTNQTIHRFKNIGVWNNNESFTFDLRTPPQFGIDAHNRTIHIPVHSRCNQCKPGQFMRNINSSCCGFCDVCLGQLFSNTSEATECMNCSVRGHNMWGNDPTTGSTGCVEIPRVNLEFRYSFAIIITIMSIIGIILLIVVFILLAVYWKSPVIKASSRESVVLVLVGAGCSFVSSLVYLGPPFLPICALQRILLWFCFSLMNGSLLIKMIRVTRIFIFQKRKMSPHRCAQPYQQVLLTMILVAIQMVIVIGSNILDHPRVTEKFVPNNLNPNALPEMLNLCRAEPLIGLILSVIYEAGLIISTVILGTLTFKNPANFNESKSVCVSAYILLCIWTMFFISNLFTESVQNVQNAFIAFTNTLGAYTILACVVGPRLFTVMFRKEKNSNRFSRRDKKQSQDKGVPNALPTTVPVPAVV